MHLLPFYSAITLGLLLINLINFEQNRMNSRQPYIYIFGFTQIRKITYNKLKCDIYSKEIKRRVYNTYPLIQHIDTKSI